MNGFRFSKSSLMATALAASVGVWMLSGLAGSGAGPREEAVAAVPEHSIFPYAKGEPGRGILYPFTEPAPGEWHSPWDANALACTREVVRKVLAYHRSHEDSPLRWITTEMINLPDYAHNARFSLIGQNATIARFVRETWSELGQ